MTVRYLSQADLLEAILDHVLGRCSERHLTEAALHVAAHEICHAHCYARGASREAGGFRTNARQPG